MGDENHGLDKAAVHHIAQHFDDHFLAGHIQRGRRLIGNEHLGGQNGGHRDDHALLHAARKLHRVLVQRIQRQAQLRKAGLGHIVDHFIARLGIVRMNDILNEAENLAGGVQGVHGRLRDVGDFGSQDVFTDGIRVHAGNVFAVDDDIPACIMKRREIVAHQRKGERGFSAPGFARDAQAFPFLNGKRHMIHRVNVLAETGDIFGGQIPDLQHGLAHLPLPPNRAGWD